MMTDKEVKHQATQFLEGPLLKGIGFEQWADSKDLSDEDRERISDYLEARGIVMHLGFDCTVKG